MPQTAQDMAAIVAWVKASSPDVLTGEGQGDLDAVAVLAMLLWALPADQRSTVAALSEHP